MESFSDYSVWSFISILAVLLIAMLLANLIKKSVKFLKNSLVPTSVLGGLILLVISITFESITGKNIFDTEFFGSNGVVTMEILTYHCLALGFIASALKNSTQKFTKERSKEIFNSGVTTVATYLLQAVLGLGITIIAALIMTDFFSAAGILLPFGFGQGTGQALNYGIMYETENGFVGGRSFGLTIAALGFLAASIGGVVHMNILRRKGLVGNVNRDVSEKISLQDIQTAEEISINGSIDKFTIQVALVFLAYSMTYGVLIGLSKLIPSFATTLFGFNFLFGVLMATLLKAFMNLLKKKKIMKKEYVNNFMMNRISGFCFDLMVIAGIGAIRISVLKDYWVVIAILALVGTFSTYFYNLFIAKKMFKNYAQEQFLAMYGMLTGTASTGVILLREIDKDFLTPASDNLVYQQIPAIAFGFPIMLLAKLAPDKPVLTLIILVAFFVVMNIILFRSYIFKKKNKGNTCTENN